MRTFLLAGLGSAAALAAAAACSVSGDVQVGAGALDAGASDSAASTPADGHPPGGDDGGAIADGGGAFDAGPPLLHEDGRVLSSPIVAGSQLVYLSVLNGGGGRTEIHRAPLDGTGSPVTVATAQGTGRLFADGASLYWAAPALVDGGAGTSDAMTLYRAPLDGATAPQGIATWRGFWTRGAFDGTSFYFPMETGDAGTATSIGAFAAGGGAITSLATMDATKPALSIATGPIANDPIYALLAVDLTDVIVGVIARGAASDGGAPGTLDAPFGAVSSDLVVDPEHVYAFGKAGGDTRLLAISRTGKPTAVLATALDAPVGLVEGGGFFYFVSGEAPWKLAMGGGAPVKLAEAGVHASGLAMDATSVYVTTSDGSIRVVPR